MEKKRAFGELELAILQVFKSGEKMNVKEVLSSLSGDNKYTTVMTVMGRMAEKRTLSREKNGLQYEYWLNEKHQTGKQPSFLNNLKEKIFGGKSALMVSYLLDSSDDITDDDLMEMERKIKKIKESRKKS